MKGHLHLPHPHNQRLQRIQAPTYERLQARLAEDHSEPTEKPLSIHCGWGRLLIGQTYPDAEELARDLLQEAPGERDIALYVAAPQQVLAHAPQQLFLDPSDTLRLWFTDYRPARRPPRGFRIRRVHTEEDWAAINRLYLARGMLPVQTERLSPRHQGGPIYWLAEDADTGVAVGTVMGLNHAKAFQDPEGGSSLWCLAVDPQCSRPGVGEALVRHLVEHFMSRELAYLDLSVLHNNQQAKALYRKLGFRELATFTIKRKNGINQSLFLGPGPEEDLNPYARIIVDEAHRRGIEVRVDDAEGGLFTLTQGGRQIRCRESLSDLTTAVSMTLCQDKVLTHRALQHAGLRQPQQRLAGSAEENAAFLAEHGSLVVKPVDGEQGQGVAVDLRTADEVEDRRRPAQHPRADRGAEPPAPGRHRRGKPHPARPRDRAHPAGRRLWLRRRVAQRRTPGRAAHRQPAHRRHPRGRHRRPPSGPPRGRDPGRAGPGNTGGGPGLPGRGCRPARLRDHRSQRARRPGQPRAAADRRTLRRSSLPPQPRGAFMTPLPQPDLNYLQRVLLEMLAIPSPTGFTDTIVRYVAEQLDELGVPFEMTRRGTIRATLQGRLNTPDRAVSAHLDTIGALVREIKPNGRLGLAPVGCWSSRFAEGSRVTVFTEQGVFRGSVLPLLASGHAFNTEVDNLKISWDNIELRLDAYTASRADSESLGISVGDYVAFDPLPEFTESGHISARHLDDKAGVAALLAALKAVKESGQEPPIDCHPLFTITEEVGSGAAGALPWDVSEFVGIDIAPVAEGQNSNEHSVSVAMQDSGGPYDFHLSRHLLRLGERHDIALRRDLFRYYHSDAQSAIAAGHDTRAALLAFGCDATHGYERTHIDSLAALSRLLTAYILSPPVFASDAKPRETSLERFNKQLEHPVHMESCTHVPPVDEVLDSSNNSDKD